MKAGLLGLLLVAAPGVGSSSPAIRSGDQPGETDRVVTAVECGLIPPDSRAPLRAFSPERYRTQAPACLADRMSYYNVPGVTIALIDSSRIVWTRAYGVLEAGSSRPVTPQSVFEAASATKILTTVVSLRLAERGIVDLDRDVNDYLQSWKLPAGASTVARPVTLRLLLTHRAGINRPDGGLPVDDQRVPTLAQVLAGAPPAVNRGVVVERTPGSGWSYSNIGFLVVQLVLEDATGKSFEQLARELVFGPLGLESCTLRHPLGAEWRSRWGVPHDEKGVAHARNQLPGAVAHGGLVATPSDLARLALEIGLAFEGRSTRLISSNSARLMLSRSAEADSQMFGGPVGQGLGVLLLGEGPTLHLFHPGGNDPGANCWVITSPSRGQGAVIMTNGAGGEGLMLEILASIAHAYRWPDLSGGR